MSTFERINENITTKIKILKKIIKYADILELKIDCKKIRQELEQIENNYISVTFMLVNEYTNLQTELDSNYFIDNKSNSNIMVRKNELVENLKQIIELENINTRVHYNKQIIFNATEKCSDSRIKKLRKKYNDIPFDLVHYEQKMMEKCMYCLSSSLKVYTYKLVCNSCGKTEDVKGNCFADETASEVVKSKYGSYDPIKRCRSMVDQIQARESKEIPDSLLEEIRELIKAEGRGTTFIECDQYRKYLHKLKKPIYNEHIPLIRKLTIGYAPPLLTDTERNLINVYIEKVIILVNKIKPVDKPNCPYHLYFIYKIIEQILPKSPRRTKILECIHLQSPGTLTETDIKFWKPICELIPRFKYTPTIKQSAF